MSDDNNQELSAEEQFRQQALDYHAVPTPGKIEIALTKPANSAKDLALAYSPGVAEPVREIAQNIDNVYTSWLRWKRALYWGIFVSRRKRVITVKRVVLMWHRPRGS